MILILVTVLKSGGTWDFLAQKTSTFERSVNNFLPILIPNAHENLVSIMQVRLREHRVRLQKRRSDIEIEDDGELDKRYTNYWSILVDKGYQGSREFIRAIHPHKNLLEVH